VQACNRLIELSLNGKFICGSCAFINALILLAAMAIVGITADGISRGLFGWP
jgi:hypothetical protein